MKYKPGTFTQVPNMQHLKGMRSQTQVVYLWITQFADKDGVCFPSINTLTESCSVGKDSVSRAIKELVHVGLLKKDNRVGNRGQKSNIYYILLKEDTPKKKVAKDLPKDGRVEPKTLPKVTPPTLPKVSNNTHSNKTQVSVGALTRQLDHSLSHSSKKDEEKMSDAQLISSAIKLFEKVFPMEFSIEGKKPYAIQATRNLVAAALAKKGGLEGLRSLVDGYVKYGDGNKYCPQANNIFGFCAKLDAIERFVRKEQPRVKVSDGVEPGDIEKFKHFGAFAHDMQTPLLDAFTVDAIAEYNYTDKPYPWVRKALYLSTCMFIGFWWKGDPPIANVRELYEKVMGFVDFRMMLDEGSFLVNTKGEAFVWDMKTKDLVMKDDYDPMPYVTKGYQFFKHHQA